jgi:hypothetical protein
MNNNVEKQEKSQVLDFAIIKKDKNGNETNEVEILQDKFIVFLQSLGYFRYDIDETILFVQIKNNIIKEIRISDIKDSIKALLENTENPICFAELIKRKIMQGSKSYLSEEKLVWLKSCNHLSFNKSTSLKGFLYFRNGFVEITNQSWQFKPYNELQGLVWNKQVIEHDFTDLTTDKSNLEYVCNGEIGESVFYQFLKKIAYLKNNSEEHNHDRLLALCTMLGYLVHDFTDTKMQAINLTDSKIGNDKEENNGRTGKSLVMQALKKITDVCEIKGKSFKSDSSHKYQNISISTRITAFNDVKDNFQLETVYDAITEGYEVERKNKKPFNVIAKTLITSNRPLKINGDSDKDRVIEFEVSDYFSQSHQPSDEFKHLKKENQLQYWFFRDWDSEEWNKFYNFFVQCMFVYFINGLIRPLSVNLDTRKLQNETASEFINFMQDLGITFDNNGLSQDFCKGSLFNDFIAEYPDYNKSLTQKKFTIWLRKYAKYTQGFAELTEKDEWRNQQVKPNTHHIRFRQQIAKT